MIFFSRADVQEGDMLHLFIYIAGCQLKGNRINYAVTSHSSGHIISWGQEYLISIQRSINEHADNQSDQVHPSDWTAEFNLRYSNERITRKKIEHC